jgi:hypothetical protein
MGEKMAENFAESGDFHVTFGFFTCRKARHGTDGFTSPPKERGFFRPKNPTASAGFEPANLGTKGQHATSRPPKPLVTIPDTVNIQTVFLKMSTAMLETC